MISKPSHQDWESRTSRQKPTRFLLLCFVFWCVLLLARDVAEKLRLQNELSFFIFLGTLVGFVVLPAHGLFTLTTGDVTDNVPTSSHVAFTGIANFNIDDIVEQVGFSVLATKVL